jgi:hypothetical protein
MYENYCQERAFVQFAGKENQANSINTLYRRSSLLLNVKVDSSDAVKSSGLCTDKGEIAVLN